MLRNPDAPLSLYPWLVGEIVPKRPTMREIAATVAESHGITVHEMRLPARSHRIAHPRQEAMWRMCQTGLWSTTIIGKFFGLDHTTVLHGREAHAARMRGEKYVKPSRVANV